MTQQLQVPVRTPLRATWDLYFAATLIVVGLLCLRLVHDSALWNWVLEQNGNRKPIAELLHGSGGVRYRFKESLLWHDSGAGGHLLSSGDSVFAGPDGLADVKMKSGIIAQLLPDSLIVINQEEEKTSENYWFSRVITGVFDPSLPAQKIQVDAGQIRLKIEKGAKPVEMILKGKSLHFEATSETATVRIDVGAAGSTTPVKIEVEESRTPVAMSWTEAAGKKRINVAQAQTVIAPVAGDDQITIKTKEEIIETETKAAEAKAAEAKAAEAKAAEAKAAEARAAKAAAFIDSPVLRNPISGFQQKLEQRFLLSWTTPEGAKAFGVQISSTPNFEAPATFDSLKLNHHIFTAPRQGAYFWRVKALKDGGESTWSESFTFNAVASKTGPEGKAIK